MCGKWDYKLSVLDHRDIGNVDEAFKIVYDFYVSDNVKILDLCCGKKLMYGSYKYPGIKTNDLRKDLKADYHFDCRDISSKINDKFDWFIYDPPYVDIKGRDDEREDDYGYEMVGDLEDFKQFTIDSKKEIIKMMRRNEDFYRNGIIAKITDFHWDDGLHGHQDLIEWFSPEFYLWDLRIYRFFKRGYNINFYTKKCFKTHSYFLVFKPEFPEFGGEARIGYRNSCSY